MHDHQQTRAFIPPCATDSIDGLTFFDFEWERCSTLVREVAPPVKLPRGWRNRQRKRLDRITRELADLDARIFAADTEKAARIGAEIQRDLEMMAEKDRRLQELNRQRADLQADAEVTAKYVAQVTAAMGRVIKKEKKKLLRDIHRDQQIILDGIRRKFGRSRF
jgi:cell division septum initiation protein DivIVA